MPEYICRCYFEEVEIEVEAETLEEVREEAEEQAESIVPYVDYCECEEV